MSIVMAVGVTWLALIAAMVVGWHRVMQRTDRPVLDPRRPGPVNCPALPVQRGVTPDSRRTHH
ncbi:MAG: hypothetical protein V9E98_09770 [Candidatus Nanopelagicales bacterium]